MKHKEKIKLKKFCTPESVAKSGTDGMSKGFDFHEMTGRLVFILKK